MSILVDKNTQRRLSRASPASAGSLPRASSASSTARKVVAGVTPGRGGAEVRGQGPRSSTPSTEAVKQTGANASCIFVPPPVAADAILEAVDAGCRARRLHHRGHPGARHGARCAAASRRASDAPHRPELPRRHHAGRVQDRHHARPHPQAGQHRRRLALGHAHLRGRRAAHGARHRPVDVRRHRRRSGRRASTSSTCSSSSTTIPDTHGVIMIGEIGGSAEERGRRVDQGEHEEAGRGVHRRRAPRRRASAWATPARSSRAARARPRRRSRRSRPRASRSRRRRATWRATLKSMMK